ncbi:hypothetical protein B0H17DRAFT_1125376 [Mycena rosella]|uniref:Uncharacterized protein n=1 Tax=Mycena rosella TaxID=1033263 RepID=A0AAD7GY58_MYCRO|nr:hypothetical protein B0H17DRAFT_1125376 [Mycena rosella]
MARRLSRTENQNFCSFSEGLFHPSAQALTYILANATPDELHSTLVKALRPPLPFTREHTAVLLSAFQAAGVPGATTAERVVAADNLRHCARCHNSYYEKDNGRFACLVLHDNMPPVPIADNQVYSQINAHYPCCQQPTLYHFQGRHTTMTESVYYTYTNIQRCEDNPACPNHYIASIQASRESLSPDCSTSELGQRLDAEMEETQTEGADSGTEDDEPEFDAQLFYTGNSYVPGRS